MVVQVSIKPEVLQIGLRRRRERGMGSAPLAAYALMFACSHGLPPIATLTRAYFAITKNEGT